MMFFYRSFLLFLCFSALFINPNASPSHSAVGFSRITKVALPLFKDPLLSTMELVQNVTSTLSQIHGDDDDPYLDVTIEHCANFLSEAARVLNWTLSSIDHTKTSSEGYATSDVISHARTLLHASLGSEETFMEALNATTSHFKVTRSLERLSGVTASIYHILDILQLPQGSPDDFSKVSSAPILTGSAGLDQLPKTPNVTVSHDGKGNFKQIQQAIAAAPSRSAKPFVILVKKGVYKEYVNIDDTKTNIVLMGEGKDATIISGSKSVGGGQTTFDSATFAVKGHGFVSIDIGFENTAGQKNGQAVAVLIAGDHVVFYRCKIAGNQDTLLVHAGRQFFRECQITGTVDFIFGFGTAVFQKCNIFIIKNQVGGTSVIAAHGRNSSTDASGFSFHGCTINGDPQPPTNSSDHTGAYLGRNWGTYARTVFMQSTISNVLRPEGWLQWQSAPVDKLYFGEYQNSGPGAALGGRVKWPGFHEMTAADAEQYTVGKFIDGNSWIPASGVPFAQGLNPAADPQMGAYIFIVMSS